MKFLDEIKKELRPSDLILKEVDSFIKKINESLMKSRIKARCVRGGSTAKGTFLKGDHDVDLFVVFDYSYRGKDISKALAESIKSLKPQTVHGSRDYFHIKKDNMTFEIVPVLEVKDTSNVENVTDMSPHHVAWVNERLNDNLRDDIRLTKKFCKAAKVYGAESYIQGFSGHVIDILIIHYGGFLNLLKAASKWKKKTVIDVMKHHKDALKELDKSKTYGPLIIVDPVQKGRNAAAAISEEKFERFIEASKAFLKKPSKEFFMEKTFNIEKIRTGKGNQLVIVDIVSLDGKTDVVGAKILKIHEQISRQLMLNNFTILETDWKWDKRRDAQIYFLIKEKLLSKTFVRQGPPPSKKFACIDFKAKNKDVFTKDKRLYANVERKFRTPLDLVKAIVKEDFIKEKAKKISVR